MNLRGHMNSIFFWGLLRQYKREEKDEKETGKKNTKKRRKQVNMISGLRLKPLGKLRIEVD